MAQPSGYRQLERIARQPHSFEEPKKCINDGDSDLPFFLKCQAYTDITTFLLQLNISMFPQNPTDGSSKPTAYPLDSQALAFPPIVRSMSSLLQQLEKLIEEIPPDPGPRRFGNVSFRRWYEKVEEMTPTLLLEHLAESAVNFPCLNSTGSPLDEIKPYFLGSFGSAQRLDYGTGHELSFLAFLGCLWKLGCFDSDAAPGVMERAIVAGVLEPYFMLVRRLIVTYTLEPAGSHGVWGLDDHFFLPYIFGSAQLSPPIPALDERFRPEMIPAEGSLENAPRPSEVVNQTAVERERKTNMYFRAIGFIYDVKKGPFWEHSRILYDISGIPTGWAKINKGMLKMYNAQVLSKFPVVQHFPFGSLFRWTNGPGAAMPPQAPHSSSHAASDGVGANAAPVAGPRAAQHAGSARLGRAANASQTGQRPGSDRRLPPVSTTTGRAVPGPGMAPTAAPWARPSVEEAPQDGVSPPTRAPWADTQSKR